VLDPSRLLPETIALAAILIAMVAVVGTSAIASWAANRRRQAASLTAIDFVRASFVSHLIHGEPMDEVLHQVVEELRGSIKLESAEIWLAGSAELELAAADPEVPATAIALPRSVASILSNAPVSGRPWLVMWLPALLDGRDDLALRLAPIAVEGEPIGVLLVTRAGSEDRLSTDADGTLAELAREIGSALKKQRLDAALHESMERLRQQAEDLRASRTRIVAAADAERRRIERDLHDGAQQYLVAVAMKASLVQELSEQGDSKAKVLLQELISDTQTALDELRDLAHGIYPPLLSSDGLAGALGAVCRRAPLPTRFESDGIGRYQPATEAAIYFCCLEGLQNAAKYAGERASARVAIWEEPGSLRFEVSDDGVGFDPATVPTGAGFTNMGDRMGAVGGELTVESRPREGTRVRGVVPLPNQP
jgi:signal transduction histidine kinase